MVAEKLYNCQACIMLKKAPMDKSASSFDIMGFGTRFCARNAGVTFSYPYIATKWMTILYLRLASRHVCPTTIWFKRRGVARRGQLRPIAHCGVKEAAMEGQQRPRHPLAHCELGSYRAGYRIGDCKL